MHTFVILELSSAAFNEIKDKLSIYAEYRDNCFIYEDNKLIIDMHGIAVQEKTKEPS